MEIAIIAVLALVAFAVISAPILRGRGSAAIKGESDVPVEQEVERYREAVRADTVCRRCGQANPPGSKYCCDCGRRLPALDAEEFEGTEAA